MDAGIWPSLTKLMWQSVLPCPTTVIEWLLNRTRSQPSRGRWTERTLSDEAALVCGHRIVNCMRLVSAEAQALACSDRRYSWCPSQPMGLSSTTLTGPGHVPW